MGENSISVSELLGVISTEGLSKENFDLITSHIILPEYHDALWVALDEGSIAIEKIVKITDFVINNPVHVPDVRVACLLYFLLGWRDYRAENYHKAHDGAYRALGIAKNYGPAKKLMELIHNRVEQSRIPALTLNDQGRVNPIEPTEPEELEINPRWL